MVENNKITIVTVTYNAKDVLEETILSVINQDHENIEYIIIDGGSTDGTADIIKKYEDHISYWVSEPDDGIYYAMNKAIEKASGDWINFMNAGDTLYDSKTLSTIVASLKDDTDLLYGDHVRDNSHKLHKAQNRSNWYKAFPFSHQALYTKTTLMKNTKFDTRFKLAADHDFIIKMIEEDKKFQYLEKPLAHYIGGGFSQSEPFTASVESLYILLHSKATQEEIEASWWYKLLKTHISTDQNLQLKQLQKAIQDLSSIKFLWHPIEKIKRYKNLMKIYHNLQT